MWYPLLNLVKVMGLVGIHDIQMPLHCFSGMNPLPLVWKGGPVQGDHGQSPTNCALQARPGVQQMS